MLAALGLIGPRFAILVWWLFNQTRWELAFSNFLVAFVGFFLAPWTTMAYVAIFPGGVTGFDWFILGIAVVMDISSWSGGARSGRNYQTAS